MNTMKHLYTKQNLQFLMTKIYKTKNNLALAIMHHLFQFCENIFNLKNFRKLVTQNKKTSNYGLETVGYRTRFLLAKIISENKKLTSVSEFKTNIKN